MPETVNTPIACRPHNHNSCVETAMTAAKRACQESGARLTTTREQVLLLIWQSHKPLGAYDIIDQLSERMRAQGKRQKSIAPPTVYRALDFLQERGFIHRIASLNAFVGCSIHDTDHISQFLLCRDCGIAIEIASQAVNQAISRNAMDNGFSIDTETIEIIGRCSRCTGVAEL